MLLPKEKKRCEKTNLCELWMASVLYLGIDASAGEACERDKY